VKIHRCRVCDAPLRTWEERERHAEARAANGGECKRPAEPASTRAFNEKIEQAARNGAERAKMLERIANVPVHVPPKPAPPAPEPEAPPVERREPALTWKPFRNLGR
jgi:hypothetical protein